MAYPDYQNGLVPSFGAANGDSDVLQWPGGAGTVTAAGTWGGGTLTLFARPAGSNRWVAVPAGALSGDGMFNFELYGVQLKLTLSGATSPSLDVGLCR